MHRTRGADGNPQVNPVGFRVTAAGDVVIGGRALARTRKFRNVAATGRAIGRPYAVKVALTECGQVAAVVLRRWE